MPGQTSSRRDGASCNRISLRSRIEAAARALRGREDYAEAPAREVRPKTREVAVSQCLGAQLFDSSGTIRNPDDLVLAKGGLGIYDEMRRDDAIGAFMQFRKWARLASGWKIVPASDAAEDRTVAAFVDFALGRYLEEPDIRTVLMEIMSAYDYGYSVTEKVWARVDEGEWTGKWALRRLSPKRPHAFEFAVDEVGRLRPDGVVNVTPLHERVPMNPADFVLYSYSPEFGNPYGRSDLRRAHTWWVMKKHLVRFQAIYFERLAGGFFDVSYDPNGLGDEAELDDMEEALESVTIMSNIMHSDAFKVTMMEASGRGALAYDRAIQTTNAYCARTILVPDLMGLSTKATGGSYAMASKHQDTFLWVLEAMGHDLEVPVIGRQVIQPLVELNFGKRYALPEFRFKPMSHEDKVGILAMFVSAVEKGVLKPTEEDEKWVRSMLDAPAGGARDGKAEPAPAPGWEKPDDEPPAKPQEADEPPFSAIEYNALRRRLKSYELRTDFALIERSLDSLEESAADGWKRIALDQQDNLIKAVRSRKLIEKSDYKGVDDLQLRHAGDVKTLLEQTLCAAYANAKYQAWREAIDRVEKNEFRVERYAAELLLEPVPAKEAIAFFAAKGLVIKPSEFRPYERNAYHIAGVENKQILAKAQAIVTRGIRRGDALWTEQQLKRLFDKYVETGQLGPDGLPSKAYHVETVVRTNLSEAFNAGRMEAYHHPDLAGEIEGYWYSAVLDDATTPYCEWMDKNSPYTKEEFEREGPPPAHYQCRSTFGAILRGEQWQPHRLRPPADATRQEGFSWAPGKGGCRCHTGIIIHAE